jgi:exodeoxyribonuclease III
VKLATWNVNSLTIRLPRVLQFLEEHKPDVLCLQETKVSDAAFPTFALASAGYHGVHRSEGQWAGVAILARNGLPLENAIHELPEVPIPAEARWIEATIDNARLCSVYVPNGRAVGTPTFDAKLRFLDAVAERVRACRNQGPLVVLGDFNVAPEDVDVYDPAAFIGSTHVTSEERKRIQVLLESGLIDAYRRLHANEVGFTWWDYRAGHFHRKLGMRIDLALISTDLADRLVSCGIDRNYRKGPKPSDHAPLILELT